MEENKQNKIFLEEDEEIEWPNKEDRILASICYIPLWFLVPFFMQKESKFLSFHFKQWLVLFLLYFFITSCVFIFLPSWIMFRMWWLFFLCYIWFIIFLSMTAYNWKSFEIWFITKIINLMKEKTK